MENIDPRIASHLALRNKALRAFQDSARSMPVLLSVYAASGKNPKDMTCDELAWILNLRNSDEGAQTLSPAINTWIAQHSRAAEDVFGRAEELKKLGLKASDTGFCSPETVFLLQPYEREAVDVLIFNLATKEGRNADGYWQLELTPEGEDNTCELRQWIYRGPDLIPVRESVKLFNRCAATPELYYLIRVPGPIADEMHKLVCFHSSIRIDSRAVTRDSQGALCIGPPRPERS